MSTITIIQKAVPIFLSLAIIAVLLLPLNLLATQRFHHDEALYATWALKIVSGDDPWLDQTPIDKPPLYLYTLAGLFRLIGVTETVARLPSLFSTAAIILLTFGLGRKLYGDGVAILAAWIVTLSPFTILFAPTTFTDPMLVALILLSCLAAVDNRAAWAGLCLGLAIATKQQGLFFLPLVAAIPILNLSPQPDSDKTPPLPPAREIQPVPRLTSLFFGSLSPFLPESGRLTSYFLRFSFTFLLTFLPALIWDISRSQPSAILDMSVRNYGGLAADLSGVIERGSGFVQQLTYGFASRLLNTIGLIVIPLLLVYGLWQINSYLKAHRTDQLPANPIFPIQFLADWLLSLFCWLFLMLHALLSFQIWDRYLLGLIPLLGLLLARALLLPWTLLTRHSLQKPSALISLGLGLILAILLAFTMADPVQDAINARYPFGSNSQAFQGIEQVAAYLQGQVGANTTLYHHWLGTHWRFYLWGYPYDLQYWSSPQALAAQAQPGHWLAFPAWRSDTELRLALFESGFGLREVVRAYALDGAPSIILYRIEPAAEINTP